jgi:hypothetical protein
MHSIVSVAQDGCSQSHGHGSGGGGGAELEHLGSIDGTSAGQNDTMITPTNHAIIPVISVNPAIRSLNNKFINAIKSVNAIKYNRLFDFLLFPIFVYTCAV